MKKKLTVSRKMLLTFSCSVLVLAGAGGISAYLFTKQQKENAAASNMEWQKQTQRRGDAEYVTEEGSVSVGTVSQTFTLDISEFTGGDTSQFSWSPDTGGFPQMNMGVTGQQSDSSQQSASSGARQLTVEEICVSVGEQVKAGDPMIKVTEETLEQIRQGMSSDVADAKNVYDQTATGKKKTEKEAKTRLTENMLYGQYADTEYALAMAELEEAVADVLEAIEEKQKELAETEEELEELRAALEEQRTVLKNAVYSVENEDRSTNAYGWLTAVNAKVDAETLIGNTEASIEEKEDGIALAQKELESLNIQLAEAQKAQERGRVEAESVRKTRMAKLESAQEIYDVAVALAEFETKCAKDDYENALARLEELDTYLADRTIRAEYDGVIMAVPVEIGDSLQEDTELIALNSYDDVTITITLSETDMDAAQPGSKAEITFTAFPDEVFTGEVTEIGDAEIDSNTNRTNYEVIIRILEDGSRLYEGMSAKVTLTRTASEHKDSISGNGPAQEEGGISENGLNDDRQDGRRAGGRSAQKGEGE